MSLFKLQSEYREKGDQAQAVKALSANILNGKQDQVLLGVTGSGKTFTMARVIEKANRPTLVISHNKTLAAQLYQEFKAFFPENAVGYFISYYDYYQPEAYVPKNDTYIEKEASINDEIDRLRHAATSSLFDRRDVIIVASVSCIYGLGSPETYFNMLIPLETGQSMDRHDLLRRLVERRYERNDVALEHGTFRVRGDVVEVFPVAGDHTIRVEFLDDMIEKISFLDPLLGRVLSTTDRVLIYPKSHYVIPGDTLDRAIETIEEELALQARALRGEGKNLETERLLQRTRFDIEMMRELGYCQGIENYSRHLTGRAPGEPPPTLIDYFPEPWLTIIDESHATIPQLRGMYRGDRSRKETLVKYGFRLPSALDNRPLSFEEFEAKRPQVIYVSATPGPYELEKTGGEIAEQIIRPTGLMDPKITVKPVEGQVDDLLEQIRQRIERNERVLVTTLTKRMAEDLSAYCAQNGIRARYLHSDIEALDRVGILRDLRKGVFDVLIGINLLREGLDLPEVSLVAILDADKEGFLRSTRSLIQTCGRAARNVAGEVVMYADRITRSMQQTIDETERRRKIQAAHNQKFGIIPSTISKEIKDPISRVSQADYLDVPIEVKEDSGLYPGADMEGRIAELEKKMREKAKNLEFEDAAILRDEIRNLKKQSLGIRK